METHSPSIQWFPGHMAKTRRLMTESLRLVDVVIELRDARVPISSANPEIAGLVRGKPRILLLNKSDLADPAQNKQWCALYSENNVPALSVDCRSGRGLRQFAPLVEQELAPLLARRREKGLIGQPLRLMIVGVPNVGKSSLINRLAGGRRAKVEDRPGVTRGRQWIKVENGMELLDMPGVLWPKFDDKWVGENLAFTGAVKDDVIDIEALAARLAVRLLQLYPALFMARYRLEPDEVQEPDGYALLSLIGRKRGMLLPGGAINIERAAIMLLDEFRSASIGHITLEKAENFRERVQRGK